MKKLIIFILLAIPMTGLSQSEWEKPDFENTEKKGEDAKVNPDQKYLEGAVTEVNGKVQWDLELDVPGKSAEQIYETTLKLMNGLTKEDNQLEGSKVQVVNKQEHIIASVMREWLVFKNVMLALDRTKFFYTLVAKCTDGHLKVEMSRITYRYEEERGNGQFYRAEEWINDTNALNKKKTKIYHGPSKFRKKTIDRKDELFDIFRKAFEEGDNK